MTKLKLAFTTPLLALAISSACSSQAPVREEEASTAGEPLVQDGFKPWVTVPGVGGGVFFKYRPAILGIGSGTSRVLTVCATGRNNVVYCNRKSTGSWAGWKIIAPPAGVTFGASGPVLTTWQNNGTWTALAARQKDGSCANCIWLQTTDPAGVSTWTSVPNSGLANGFVGDFAMGMYLKNILEVIGSTGGNPDYYARFNNASVRWGAPQLWGSTWYDVPGQGAFKAPVTAVTTQKDVLLAAVGTDGNPYTQNLIAGTGWSLFKAGSFGDSPSAFPTAYHTAPRPDDVTLVGMGTDQVEYEGDWTGGGTYFHGWNATSQNTFLSSPVLSMSSATHVDLAAMGNTQLVLVSSWDMTSPTCADGTTEEYFFGGVIGCSGAVTWPQRATLCGSHSRVCTSEDWQRAHGSSAPLHDYWTDENLYYSGSAGLCAVSTTFGQPCIADQPMRVCTPTGQDPEGNMCNWVNCQGPDQITNDFFGGCNGNPTAGTLCCP